MDDGNERPPRFVPPPSSPRRSSRDRQAGGGATPSSPQGGRRGGGGLLSRFSGKVPADGDAPPKTPGRAGGTGGDNRQPGKSRSVWRALTGGTRPRTPKAGDWRASDFDSRQLEAWDRS